jgi:hypothetical protein
MLRLISNFIDYYDHYFDLHGDIFRRMSNGGMDRRVMLEFLKNQGFNVPTFGIVKEMINQNELKGDTYVVIHTDITSHRGENKLLMPFKEALDYHPNSFMVRYVSSLKGVSWRYLKVGDQSFFLRYESEDWRSNWNTNQVVIEREDTFDMLNKIQEPLFAIDFVKKIETDGSSVMVAIDFNIAPQIRGTGVEHVLSASDAADAIKKKCKTIHDSIWLT